jgi:hypothetical protein
VNLLFCEAAAAAAAIFAGDFSSELLLDPEELLLEPEELLLELLEPDDESRSG